MLMYFMYAAQCRVARLTTFK